MKHNSDEFTSTSPSIFVNTTEIIQTSHCRSWLKVVLWICYIIIFLVGISGNSAVCFILHRRKLLQTVTNQFILNLAISDLIVSCSIPMELTLIFYDNKWPYAAFFCKIYGPLQTAVMSVSIFTLTVVSIIRYRAIVHPLKLQVTLSQSRCIIIGIWLFSTILMLPHSVTLTVEGKKCLEKWPNVKYRRLYTTSLFLFFYVVPLTIIIMAYVAILKELVKKQCCINCRINPALNEIWSKETTQIIRMFWRVTIVFTVCNLPSQIMWLWLDYTHNEQPFKYVWDVLLALNVLIFANSAANPFIYYIFHDRFRKETLNFLSEYKWFVQMTKLFSHCKYHICTARSRKNSSQFESKRENVEELKNIINSQPNGNELKKQRCFDNTLRKNCDGDVSQFHQ